MVNKGWLGEGVKGIKGVKVKGVKGVSVGEARIKIKGVELSGWDPWWSCCG